MEISISFSKVDLPYGWMGNMAPYPVYYENKIWKTSEALFQSMRFDDPEIREIIRREPSPMGAKMKAKSFKKKMILEPMSELDVDNMRKCLILKFSEHPEIKRKLLITGDYKIFEDIGSRRGSRHEFWGAYRNENKVWAGENRMGKLLMELREEFRKSVDCV